MKKLIFIFTLLTLLLRPFQATAEESKTALRISPLTDQIVASPGQTLTRQVYLTNLSPLPLPIKGYARTFITTDEEGGSDYPDDPTPGGVQTWFKLAEPDFILGPNSTKQIQVTINVPTGAAPGGHYATLFFESLVPQEALNENSLYLASRLGVLYFFVISGDIHVGGEFKEFKTADWQQEGPVEFKIAFENQGNISAKPKTTISIWDWRRKKVATIEDPGQTVLPGKLRRWTVDWDGKYLAGRYKARIETRLNADTAPIVKETNFWVLPIWQMVGFLVIFTFIYIFGIRARGRWGRAIKSLAKK